MMRNDWEASAMHVGRIEAAEEIQLLLPENQPEAEHGAGALAVGAALLLIALPCWGLASALRRAHGADGAAANS
jgi:hypothetical protein